MGLQRLRIFISSPGDVAEERVLANNLVRRLADEYANRAWIEPVFWEHEPLLATETFQKQIPPPHDCDVVICILWSRLGTRLPANITRPDGTGYASGTEFEFEDAATGFTKNGRPELLVYRKKADPVVSLKDTKALMERIRQKEALDAFVNKWFFNADDGTIKAAYHSFMTTADFETRLEEHLRKLIERHLPPEERPAEAKLAWTAGSPFRGLDVFEFEHASIFCGRTQAIGDVLTALRTNAAEGRGFVLIVGVSGGGKSSLARAGVIPMLTQDGVVEGVEAWRRAVLKPADGGGKLFKALAAALLQRDALPELGADGTTGDQLADLLRQTPAAAFAVIKGALSQAASALAGELKLAKQPEIRLVVLVDQLEEVFTLTKVTPEERQAFIAALASLARSGKVWVIGTIRGDFYHRAFELPELVALQEGSGQYALPLPRPAEFSQMIRQPARAAGLRFEEDPQTKVPLDEVLREAAGGSPESLPLLEFALEQLYQHRAPDGLLTYAAYHELGGVEGALTQRAEKVFASLPPDVQAALPQVMRGLVRVGDGGGVARQQAAMEDIETTPAAKTFVEAFVAARLFSADCVDDRSVVRVTHEALLRVWPRVQRWLADDRELLIVRSRVSDAAARWNAEGRRFDMLLGEGKPLDEACSLLARWPDELSDSEQEFVRRSIDRATRLTRAKRIAIAALVLLTTGAVLVAAYARHQRSVARAEQLHAIAEQKNASTNLGFALKATDDLAVAIAQELSHNAQIPTKDKLYLADRLDGSMGRLRDAMGRTGDLNARYARVLTFNALALAQCGRYDLATVSAERARDLMFAATPVAGMELLSPVDKARLDLALAIGHTSVLALSQSREELQQAASFLQTPAPTGEVPIEAAVLSARVEAARAQLRFFQLRMDDAVQDENAARTSFTAALGRLRPQGDEGLRREILSDLADLQIVRLDVARTVLKGKPSEIRDNWHAIMDPQRARLGEADPQWKYLEALGFVIDAIAENAAQHSDAASQRITDAINQLCILAREDPGNLKVRVVLARAALLRAEYATASLDLRQAELDFLAARTLALSLKRESNNWLMALRIDAQTDLDTSQAMLAHNDGAPAALAAEDVAARIELFRPLAADPIYLRRVTYYGRYCAASAYFQEKMPARAVEAVAQANAGIADEEKLTGMTEDLRVRSFNLNALLVVADEKEIGPKPWQAAFDRALLDVTQLRAMSNDLRLSWAENLSFLLNQQGDRLAAQGSAEADKWYEKAWAVLQEKAAVDRGDFDVLSRLLYTAGAQFKIRFDAAQWARAAEAVQRGCRCIPSDNMRPAGADDYLRQWNYFASTVNSRLQQAATQPAGDDAARTAGIERITREATTANATTPRLQAMYESIAQRNTETSAKQFDRFDLRRFSLGKLLLGHKDDVIIVAQPLGWDSVPLYAGNWRALVGDEFDAMAEQFAKTTALKGTAGARAIRHIRETTLPFYNDGRVDEAEFALPSGELYTASMLWVNGTPYELNGTSPPIHTANSSGPLKLDTPAQATAYLRFFCAYVAGDITAERNSFQLVESADQLPWEPNARQSQHEAVAPIIRPLVTWPDPQESGTWLATGTVQVGTQLSHASFRLPVTGVPDMTEDLAVASNLALQPPRFTVHGRLVRQLRTIDLQGLGESPVSNQITALTNLSEKTFAYDLSHALRLAAEAAALEMTADRSTDVTADNLPDSVKALNGASNLHFQARRFTEANRFLDAAVTRFATFMAGITKDNSQYAASMEDLSAYRAELAFLALLNGDAKRAQDLATQALQVAPNNLRARLELADAQIALGQSKVAADIYRTNAVMKFGDIAWLDAASKELAALEAAGKFASAVQAFRADYSTTWPALRNPVSDEDWGKFAKAMIASRSASAVGDNTPATAPSADAARHE